MALTVFSGCVAFLLMLCMQKPLRERHPDLYYIVLRLTCVFCVLPVGYIALGFLWRGGHIRTDDTWQVHFKSTDVMQTVYVILMLGWLLKIVYAAWERRKDVKKFFEMVFTNIPEEDETAEEIFDRIKKELRIRGFVRLRRNDSVPGPLIMGMFCTTIVLPYVDLDKDNLEVTFYHELTHCKYHDTWFGSIAFLAGLLVPVHIVTEYLKDNLNRWNEYHCDSCVLARLSGEHSMTFYFRNIVDTILKSCGHPVETPFTGLCESETELDRRIQYMEKYKTIKHLTRRVTVALAAVFAVINVSTAYAASVEIAEAHDTVYLQTEAASVVSNSMFDKTAEVHFVPGDRAALSKDVDVEYAPDDKPLLRGLSEGEVKTASWNVPPEVRMMSTSFKVTSGKTISFSVVPQPTGVHYWYGIMRESNGDMYYVNVPNGVSHGYDFSVPATDRYRTFVHNKGSQTMTAHVTYYFH